MLSKSFTGIALLSISLSGCFNAPIGSIGSVNRTSGGNTFFGATDTKSITNVDANTGNNVILGAPSMSGMDGASVMISPGSLSVSVDLVIEQGADLSATDLTTELGLSEGVQVSSSTPGMIVRPSEQAELKKPMTISMPLPATTALNLAGSKFVIFYKYFDPSEQKLMSGMKVVDGVQARIAFDDKAGKDMLAFEGYFGAYWAALLSRELTAAEVPAPKATEQPILNKAMVAVFAPTGIIKETEIVKAEATPALVWDKPTLTLNAELRSVKLAANAPTGQTVTACKVDLFESTLVQTGLVLDSPNGTIREFAVPGTNALTMVGRFRCLDAQNRMTVSPWSDVLLIPTFETPINKAPGVDISTSDLVSVSGVLSPRKDLFMVTLIPGESNIHFKSVAVDANGFFRVELDRSQTLGQRLKDKISADPIIKDAALHQDLINFFHVTESELQSYLANNSDTTLRTELIPDIDRQMLMGTTTAFVAYTKSEPQNKLTEAASFKFIGLPISGENALFTIPTRSLKGNVRLGTITFDSGIDAYAQVSASAAVNESAETIAGLGLFGRNSDYFKNAYNNTSWQAKANFMWKTTGALSTIANTFTPPLNANYKGYSFHSHSRDAAPFTFDNICGIMKKPLRFDPPSSVYAYILSVLTPFTTFNNADAIESVGFGDKRHCQGTGFFAHQDGDRIGFGFAGGTLLQNEIPAGFWQMKYDGAVIGRYNFSSYRPLDVNGKPKIFVPSVKFIKTGSDFTGAQIKFHRYVSGAYAPVTDLSYLRKLANETYLSLWGSSGSEHRVRMEIVAGSSEVNITFATPIPSTSVYSGAVEYSLGDQTYRFEYGQ